MRETGRTARSFPLHLARKSLRREGATTCAGLITPRRGHKEAERRGCRVCRMTTEMPLKTKNRLTIVTLCAFAGATFAMTMYKLKQQSAVMEFSNTIPAKDALKDAK